jgi:hypothetical protein
MTSTTVVLPALRPGLLQPDRALIQAIHGREPRRYRCGDRSVAVAVCGAWITDEPTDRARPCGLCLDRLGLLPGVPEAERAA